jgi:hypothetical protein
MEVSFIIGVSGVEEERGFLGRFEERRRVKWENRGNSMKIK